MHTKDVKTDILMIRDREINVEVQMRNGTLQIRGRTKDTNVEKGYTAIHNPDKTKRTRCDLCREENDPLRGP